ncbi:MAG TPA: hypothetical protein VN700_08220 [Vicinamibacterales bacterium]|nr:hypothetical protein [Vicinamibacterales bacterium]
MRVVYGLTVAIAIALITPNLSAQMQDVGKAVAGGGIKVAGWQATVDAGEAKAGLTVDSAKFESAPGGGIHVVTGPAITYWNPKNVASGNYTVKATFTEKEFMNLNDHAHPYGIVIGGNDLGTPNATLLYCNAYGNGTFIVRGFAPTANGTFAVARRPEANAAINKASGKGASVTQEIALSVKGDKIECAVNGTVVGSYDKAMAVGEGKLKSTDGVYGLRFGHNTEVTVTGFAMSKN